MAKGAFSVEWGKESDLRRAYELNAKYRTLRLGFVDSVVIATTERLGAKAIATFDLRHF